MCIDIRCITGIVCGISNQDTWIMQWGLLSLLLMLRTTVLVLLLHLNNLGDHLLHLLSPTSDFDSSLPPSKRPMVSSYSNTDSVLSHVLIAKKKR